GITNAARELLVDLPTTHGSRAGSLRHRARPLLGHRLVRTCVVRNRVVVRAPAKRGLRRDTTGSPYRAGLGFAVYWCRLPLHRRVRGRDGGDPARRATLLRMFVSQLCFARSGWPGASHRAIALRIPLPLVLGDHIAQRIRPNPASIGGPLWTAVVG